MIVGILLASVLFAPPDRRCERPAYHLEDLANTAQQHAELAVASRDREAAARVYLRCRRRAPRPQREVFWEGIDDVLAAELAWETWSSKRGCRLFEAGDTLMRSAEASGRLTSHELMLAATVMDDAPETRRDSGAHWYPNGMPPPCR